jgi:pimeloyl-ACP methyl ester carboxylesterase
MSEYVQLGDVSTWYDQRGDGDPLVLMHGGLVDARAFAHNIDALAEHFRVFTPERRGHGHTPDVEGPITYDLMTADTLAFLEAVVRGPAHLVGHSDGAVIGLLIALRRPELVRRLVLVSGGFHRDGLMAGEGEPDVDEVVEFLGSSYGEVSPDGEEHLSVVVEKINEMAAREPALEQSELANVESRTLVMFGDDDLMSVEHMNATYEGIPDSELAIVPGTSHFLLEEKPALCNRIIVDFLTSEPVPTVAPIRRRPTSREQ